MERKELQQKIKESRDKLKEYRTRGCSDIDGMIRTWAGDIRGWAQQWRDATLTLISSNEVIDWSIAATRLGMDKEQYRRFREWGFFQEACLTRFSTIGDPVRATVDELAKDPSWWRGLEDQPFPRLG